MAKKKSANKVNKSELIRAYIAEFPDKKPKEVAEFISAQIGEKISPQFVSTTKSNAKKAAGKKPGKRGRKPKGIIGVSNLNGSSTNNGFTEAAPIFKAAGSLIKMAGSAANARQAIDIMAQFVGNG